MKMRSLVVSATVLLVAAAMSTGTVLLQEGSGEGGSGDWNGWNFESANPPVDPGTDVFNEDAASIWGEGTPGLQFGGTTDGGIYDDIIFENEDLAVNIGDSGLDAFGVTMDFYVNSGSPSPELLSFYFQDFDGDVWYYDLADPSEGWNSYAVVLGSGWYSYDTAETFDFSINEGALQEVGILMLYDDVTDAQQYGIGGFAFTDEEDFYIPEPGTYMVLSVAFMSMGFSFRRRQREEKS